MITARQKKNISISCLNNSKKHSFKKNAEHSLFNILFNLWEDSDGSSAMHVLMHFRYFEACGSACIIQLRRSYTGMYNIHTFERASEAFLKVLQQ